MIKFNRVYVGAWGGRSNARVVPVSRRGLDSVVFAIGNPLGSQTFVDGRRTDVMSVEQFERCFKLMHDDSEGE